MRLNKHSSFTLILLLSGADSAAKIAQKMPSLSLRTIQRALVRLSQAQLIERHGVTDPRYSLNYGELIRQPVNLSLLENTDRPSSLFNFSLLDWLLSDGSQSLADILLSSQTLPATPSKMTKRELEHLVIELSWKSSSLEGNTYSLLDTELLILKGVQAKNKTSFETQMILNHQVALTFIIEHPELFTGDLHFSTVEKIHSCIVDNLGIQKGIRRRPVKITTSNYQPSTAPAKLRESADSILSAINKQRNPFLKALLAFSCLPYLQPFEDGNKRIGRILANALLIHLVGRGISLKKTDAKQLALAYLSFYEFNSLQALVQIFETELRNV